MALETTVFTFKISVPFTDWAKGFDSAEVVAKAFFEASREAVEATGHIYDSTIITSYLAG